MFGVHTHLTIPPDDRCPAPSNRRQSMEWIPMILIFLVGVAAGIGIWWITDLVTNTEDWPFDDWPFDKPNNGDNR